MGDIIKFPVKTKAPPPYNQDEIDLMFMNALGNFVCFWLNHDINPDFVRYALEDMAYQIEGEIER